MFQQLIPDALVQAAGWAILHSLWQGAIITLLLAFLLGRTRQQSPALRYQLSVGALALLPLAVLVTFFQYYQQPVAAAMGVLPASSGAALFSTYLPAGVTAENADPGFLQRSFPFLLQVWLVGVALMGIRMLGELAYLHRLRGSGAQQVGDLWLERLNAMKWQMGIVQPVALKESLRVSSPMLIGWLKPVILLPVGMLVGLSPQQVECVLAHELAHVRRMDYLVNLVQSAMEVFLFFNPAVWWISAQIREEREHCCDEIAIGVTGDRLTLIKTLAQLEEWRMESGQLGLAFNGRPQGMLGRVQRLLGGESSVRIIGKGLWSLLFFSLATGLLAFQDQAADLTVTTGMEQLARLQEKPGMAVPALRHLAALKDELRAQREEALREAELRSAEIEAVDTDRSLESLARLSADQVQRLIEGGLAPLRRLRDTIPDKKWEMELRKLQEQMHQLQEEMRNSPEMQQMQEMARKQQVEMRALQEKMSSEQGGLEQLQVQHQKLMAELQQKHQQLVQSEDFKAMQQEQEKMAREFSKKTEEFRKLYQNDPRMLELKLDSLSAIFDEKHKAFEGLFEGKMEALEKEMRNVEESTEMKELQAKMMTMQMEMEKVMMEKMEPMQKQMEQLQQTLETKYHEKMRVLEEKMEQLHEEKMKTEHRRME